MKVSFSTLLQTSLFVSSVTGILPLVSVHQLQKLRLMTCCDVPGDPRDFGEDFELRSGSRPKCTQCDASKNFKLLTPPKHLEENHKGPGLCGKCIESKKSISSLRAYDDYPANCTIQHACLAAVVDCFGHMYSPSQQGDVPHVAQSCQSLLGVSSRVFSQ